MRDDIARDASSKEQRQIKMGLIPDPYHVSCNHCKRHWQLCKNRCEGYLKATQQIGHD
jgi:hypothetical protein